MGMPIAQSSKPISQQQPGGGKGMASQMPQDINAPAVMPSGQPQGKGFAQQVAAPEQQMQQQPQQYQGKGGTTNSATSGQPRMGQSNPYSNTIQPWDNASIQPQTKSGKGKGY